MSDVIGWVRNSDMSHKLPRVGTPVMLAQGPYGFVEATASEIVVKDKDGTLVSFDAEQNDLLIEG